MNNALDPVAVGAIFVAGIFVGGAAATLMWLWHLKDPRRCPTCNRGP